MSARTRLSARLPELLAEPDRALVGRFGDTRDEAAFAALVRRHGGMVFGVCRRAVRDAHLAEDAFQAVFLVLARNPAAAARASSVAGWLFGVARRVGLAARRRERRRLRLLASPRRESGETSPPELDDLLRVLDEELAALPEEYRSPLVACFLREQTQDEAARDLGWSLSTLRRWLDRGKELLRARLTRRGVTLSAGLLAAAIAPARVSAGLVEATAGLARGGSVPGGVAALAGAGLGHSLTAKLAAAAGMLLLGGIAVGFGSGAFDTSPPRQQGLETPVLPLPQTAGPPAATPPPTYAGGSPTSAPAPPRDWVLLKGRVVFPEKRAVPKPREILKTDGFVKDRDYFFSKGRQFFEELLVDPKTRGIKNAVVWLQPDADDRKAPFPKDRIKPGLMDRPREIVIDTGCCQFTPRVVAAKAGDTLRFVNKAPVAHNVNYTKPGTGADDGADDAERVFNVLLPPDGSYTAKTPLPGHRTVDFYRCNIHSWMRGYVWSFDHPYSAVTDAEGNFAIPDAPVGTWRLVIWHEKVGFKGWNQRRLGDRVAVADGPGAVTDLGAVVLETEAWDELDKGE